MSCRDWRKVKLSEICEFNKESYTSSDNWEFVNYLDTGNITEGKIENIQYINLNKDKLPSRARRKVDIGEIIYSMVRPNQKHYGIIKNAMKNMLVSTGFTTISAKKELCCATFIYYYLTQSEIIKATSENPY